MLDAVEKMFKVTQRPLCIQPNAGVPANVDGRNIYQTTPKYMAKYAKRMIQSGARIVGGCCGTTPAHIREIRNEIKALSPGGPAISCAWSFLKRHPRPSPWRKKAPGRRSWPGASSCGASSWFLPGESMWRRSSSTRFS